MLYFYDTKTQVLMLNNLFHSNAITIDLLSRSQIIEIGIDLHAKSKSILIALLTNTYTIMGYRQKGSCCSIQEEKE